MISVKELSHLKRMVDVGSAIGTAGVITGAVGLLAYSKEIILGGFGLFEVGCSLACIAGIANRFKKEKELNPNLYRKMALTFLGRGLPSRSLERHFWHPKNRPF